MIEMNKVELPPLEMAECPHGYPECNCDLEGGDDRCSITPSMAEWCEKYGILNQRERQLLAALTELGAVKSANKHNLLLAEMREETLSMAVSRLGGKVEGRETGRHNFLQRIDELRVIETENQSLTQKLAKANAETQKIKMMYAHCDSALPIDFIPNFDPQYRIDKYVETTQQSFDDLRKADQESLTETLAAALEQSQRAQKAEKIRDEWCEEYTQVRDRLAKANEGFEEYERRYYLTLDRLAKAEELLRDAQSWLGSDLPGSNMAALDINNQIESYFEEPK